MQKIKSHLWFNTEAKEAAALYTTLFENSKVTNITTLTGTPSGDSKMHSKMLFQKMRCVLDKVRMYFGQNPQDFDD